MPGCFRKLHLKNPQRNKFYFFFIHWCINTFSDTKHNHKHRKHTHTHTSRAELDLHSSVVASGADVRSTSLTSTNGSCAAATSLRLTRQWCWHDEPSSTKSVCIYTLGQVYIHTHIHEHACFQTLWFLDRIRLVYACIHLCSDPG